VCIHIHAWPNSVNALSKVLVCGRLFRFGFESRQGHGYLSLMGVVCCQVDVFATG